MPNSETYTLVWLGTSEAVPAEEVDSIVAKTNPRVAQAVESGLGWFCDSFFWDEEKGEPAYLFLMGRCLRILGYKEGDFELRIDPIELAEHAESLRSAFWSVDRESQIQLYVLFHDAGDA